MNTPFSASLKVQMFDGRKPLGEAATLMLSVSGAKLIGPAVANVYPTNRLKVSPRVGRGDRFIALPDGVQLQCPDHPILDKLPQEEKTEGIVSWLEQRWSIALLCLAATIFSVAAGYFYGLPIVAEHVAANIPIEYERELGEQSIHWLDKNGLFEPSEAEPEVQQLITEGFQEFTHDLPMKQHYRLEFRASPAIGPNAFAFPGGIVVITDELIDLSESPEEVLAVLAHEIGHVERRHAIRHLLQDSATAVLAATLTSDAASLTLAVSGLPVLLAQTKYSREFEAEADEFGFGLLMRHDQSPESFASIMEKIGKQGDHDVERKFSFLSTHPITADRTARARAAARIWEKHRPALEEDQADADQATAPDDATDDHAKVDTK